MLQADSPLYQCAGVSMDTVVSISVATTEPETAVQAAMQRALSWFAAVERACSRFDANSELRQLLGHVGQPVPASPVLFEATNFALQLARLTRGVFDPTVGRALEIKGFDRHYVTGERVASVAADGQATYRDVRLGPQRRTIRLRRPLVLDLGAVAKGLAIDLASRELEGFGNFCVEAGGDLFASGRNAQGRPWRVGVQDPRDPEAVAYVLSISNEAVCTSGDYERRGSDGLGHHLVDPRTGQSAAGLASVTVVASTAMAADGLGTAAFILGADRGCRLLEQERVGGVLITTSGALRTTRGLARSAAPVPQP